MITYQKVSWQGIFQCCKFPSKQSNNMFNMNSNIRNASRLLNILWVELRFTLRESWYNQ